MRTQPRLGEERGFTLIEMMVALLIGIVAVSQLYILTRAVSNDTVKTRMETEAMQRARIGIELLTADLERAGLNASPNPARDPDSMVNPGTAAGANNQRAFERPAIVHLNRDDASGFDSILLVGSFITSKSYQAYLDSSTGRAVLTFAEPFAVDDECLDEFKPEYSFAHVIAPNGQTADAAIDTRTCPGGTNCTCTVTLDLGELFVGGASAFASGQLVRVAANQAALYSVQTVGDHPSLVRQFVKFSSENASTCTASAFAGTADPISAKIIADYVTDFQVWFRNVRDDGDDWLKPSTYDVGPQRILPCDKAELFETTAAGCLANQSHLQCTVTTEGTYVGPEHVRSAVVRLGVRTEKTDQEVMKLVTWDADAGVDKYDEADGRNRLVLYNAAPPPSGDVGAYKVRTVVTEIMLPNIAARMASFKEIPAL